MMTDIEKFQYAMTTVKRLVKEEKRLRLCQRSTSDTLDRFTKDYLNFRRMGFMARLLWLFKGRLP
jgi:hypothetical protein